MARRRRNDDSDDPDVIQIVGGLILLYLLIMFGAYNTDRARFWHWTTYSVAALVIIVASFMLWNWWQGKKFRDTLSSLEEKGLREYLTHFISRFGTQKRSNTDDWFCRGYFFVDERLEDIRSMISDKGVRLSSAMLKQVLSRYIQEQEEQYTRDSVSIDTKPKKFSELSGSDFEQLLYRLYKDQGYSVQWTGRSGDQGCDLIVNMGNERVAIQAKCYTGSVGNAAVQQIVAAQKKYDCTKGVVITNSVFTAEAIDLAKANGTELIDGRELRNLLLQHLKESWS